MSSLIRIKRSAVSGKQPNTSILELGELALNTYDGNLFFKKNDGTESIVKIAEVNENTLSIDSSSLNNSTSSVLSGVLSDFDAAIDQESPIQTNTTLSGDGTSSDPLSLSTSGVSSNTYGSSSQIPRFTVDEYGRITNVSEVNVAGVSDFTYDANTSTLTIDTADGSSFNATVNSFDSIDVNNGDITDVNMIKFDTSDGLFVNEGEIGWSSEEGTLNVGMTGNNVTLQVGQEMLAYVKNNTANTITNGTVVAVAGAQNGRLLAQPFIADGTFLPGQIGGIATEDIGPDEFGHVNTFGYVRNIDTSAYTVGTFLYASANTPGEYSDTIPESPNLKVIVGVVTEQDANTGSIFVRTNFTPIASDITYDNGDSELLATNVKAALDELDSSKVSVDLLSSTVTVYATSANSDITGYYALVATTDDPDFDDPAVDIPTGTITANNQLVAELAADAGLFVGDPGPITVPTIGDVRRTSGTGSAAFYFEVYRRDDTGTETLLATSSLTNGITTSTYEQFSASALLSGGGSWQATDRIVLKFYGSRIGRTGSNPSYEFKFGGNNPVRTNFPVPVSVIPSDDASQVIVDTSTFNKVLSSTDSTVQDALETLDDHNHTTSEIPEGSRLYFTDLRANNAIDARVTKSFVDNLNVDADTLDSLDSTQFVRSDVDDSVNGNITFGANVAITGDLTISGNVTYIDTNQLNIGDNTIVLNKDEIGTPSQDAGIEVERGTSTNVSLVWDETNDRWTVGVQPLESGSVYIDGYGQVINSSGQWVGQPQSTDEWIVVSNTYVASSSDKILADTSGGPFTITLPPSPQTGDTVTIADGGDWNENNLTIDRNSSTIEGFTDNIDLDVAESKVELIYDGTTWQIYTNNITNYDLDNWLFKTSNFIASINDHIIADTSGGTFTIFLPSNPELGAHVYIADGSDWSNFALIVDGNGSTIENTANSFSFDISTQVDFVYDGTTWQLITPVNAASDTSSQIEILDDTTTDATRYLTFTDQTANNETTLTVSSTKLTYNPSSGTVSATDFNSTSDITLKDNIINIENPLEKIKNLRGVNFTWKDTGDYAMGVVAQEVEKVIPEVVKQQIDTKSVNYDAMVGLLIEAIKQQQKEIETLRGMLQ